MKCDDPFWHGCKEDAAYFRELTVEHKPDDPMALCQKCYEAMAEESIEGFVMEEEKT